MSEFKFQKNTTRSIIKNAAWGNVSALAKAVMKDRELNDLIMVEVINAIKREIRTYSKDPEYILKLKSHGDIRKFSHESLYQQLLVKCPKLAVLIASIRQPGNLKEICHPSAMQKLQIDSGMQCAWRHPFVCISTTNSWVPLTTGWIFFSMVEPRHWR